MKTSQTTSPSVEQAACDCHVHVIGPMDKYPLEPVRSYTPQEASASALIAMMRRLGLARSVVVQPSILGQDNRCTLDAVAQIQQAGLDARAVAVLEQVLPGSQLDSMHQAGVRGLRLNLQSQLGGDLSAARAALHQAADQCTRNGWHVQVYVNRAILLALQPELQALPVSLVLDHFGGLTPDAVKDSASLAVLDLLSSGRAWIKLSGTYRVGRHAFDERIPALAQQLASINPQRLVWASDWPHTPAHQGQPMTNPPMQPYRDIDTHQLLKAVHEWFDPALAQQVLCKNPAALYGFDSLSC